MTLLFDTIANQFDDQRGLPPEAVRAWLVCVNDFAAGRNLRVLEPGVGTGRIALPLAMAGHHITGVDISLAMLNRCAQRAFALDVADRIGLMQADATDVPVPDRSFDLGVIAQLLYLVKDWPAVLDELARVVKPGGYVVHLTEPTIESEALARWSGRWRRMVEAAGYVPMPLRPSDDEVAGEFLRRWPDVHEQKLARWRFGQTVAAARTDYGTRRRPLYQGLRDDVWEKVVAEFLAWAGTEFDGEIELGGEVTLHARIAAV